MMLIMTFFTFRSMAQFQEHLHFIVDAKKFAGDAIIEAGTSQAFIFPDHFKSEGGSSLAPLDLSIPVGPYTITASITIPNDPDLSNNVSTSLDIGVFTPAVPSLSSSADPDNIICAGDPITFTITPFSATATYTFKVNGWHCAKSFWCKFHYIYFGSFG